MKLEKVTSILLWVLLAVSAVLIIMLASNIDTDSMNSWINTNLTWTYILLFATGGAAIIFALIQTVTDPKALKSGLIALVCAAVVLGISYALASDAIPAFHGSEELVKNGSLTPSISKWVGTTLYATYVLLTLIIVAIAGFGVKQIFSSKS